MKLLPHCVRGALRRHPSSGGLSAGWRPIGIVIAAFALGACGGGAPEPEGVPGATTGVAEPAAPAPARRFVLWPVGSESALQAEQLALDPDSGGSEVRLVVRLNPAALPSSGRALAASAGGSGESADPAERAARLAAKEASVLAGARDVIARSVQQRVPGAVVKQQFSHAIEGFVTSVPWSQAQAVADALAQDPAVDEVEVDRALSLTQAVPPLRTLDRSAWGVDRIDQRTRQFDGAFRSNLTGSGVTVYVVDSGISPHSQFGDRLRPGYSGVSDGRGTVDCHSHGTHVAGTVAGATVGVAPGARVVPVRVMDCRGSSSGSQVIAGLDWIVANGVRPAVVNMSIGGPAFASLDAAVQRLVKAGYTVVAAAGNANVDACTQSPARALGAITVAASDAADQKAGFSNWGSCVSLWAPGTQIGSAGLASPTALTVMNGTSMASPHVAGAAALLLQAQPGLTPGQVASQLRSQATLDLVGGAPGGMTRSLLFAGAGGSTTSVVPAPDLRRSIRVGTLTMSTQVPAIGAWAATATLAVVDSQGRPVAGARAAGRFATQSNELTCTTGADGRCAVVSQPLPWGAVPAVGFALTGLSGTDLVDTGAGPRTTQVAQPAAPVLGAVALTGTMARNVPSATSWTPRFTVNLQDEQRVPVAGAWIQAQLLVFAGPVPVGMQMVACQTAANGQCPLAWGGPVLDASRTGAVLRVVAVSRPFLTVRPGPAPELAIGRVR